MPISIADFVRQRRTFTYDSEMGPVRITYRPYQMTPAREAEIARMAADEAADEENADVANTEQGITKTVIQFCEVVEATDMVGPLHERVNPHTGAGEGRELVPPGDTIPITPEICRYFSSAFLVKILMACAKDARPKATRRQDLNDG